LHEVAATVTGDEPVAAVPPLTLYMHLPWCVRKCPYCDFNSHAPRGPIPERAYVDALLADLDRALPELTGRPFATVFIGGGTPSLFSPAAVARLLERLRRDGKLCADAEITLEANPGTADEEHFRGYRDAGVNRLSVGIQSFDDTCLQALGRIHDADDARRAAQLAADTFDNFNLDLMYGLPGQTPTSAARDLSEALSFGPPHLSCYQLTLEPNTVFAKYPPQLPGEAVQAAIERRVHDILAVAGYRHYEVSAHATDGRECRHNRHYWEFADYLGIGAGAHSKLTIGGSVRREARVRSPDGYLGRVAAGRQVAERRKLDATDLVAEFMINALRLRDGFDLALVNERTGLPVASWRPQLERAARRGLLRSTGEHVAPTPLGRRYLNELAAEFLPD
jgi:oxygen-independent coproporphyrinogen-3 oxidase